MKEKQRQTEVALDANEEATVLINSDGEFADVTESAAEIFGRERGEILTLTMGDVVPDPPLEAGQVLERKLNGELDEHECTVICGDGSKVRLTSRCEALEIDGERHVRCDLEVIRELEPATPDTEPGEQLDPSVFDDIGNEELAEIVQNIRVDAPDGEMPLNAIMLDLAVGHNELEQYKKGALSLHEAVDERLKEEEELHPDSPQCEVLREVKQTAFGLYLRLQRGDEELHGNRGGRYSGYFNSGGGGSKIKA